MNEQDKSQRAAMKAEIRKVVGEEIQNSRNPQVTNIFSRMHNLIRAASRDVANAYSTALTTPATSSFTFNSKKRSVPSHPNRFSSKKCRGGCSVSWPKMLLVALLLKQQGDNEQG